MNRKLSKSLIAFGAISATAMPLVSLVSFAPNESSKGFIFKGRIFYSNEEAMKYLINNKLIDVSETKVVGDLPHAFSNAEKGLINKYLLPDYVPRNMHFAYFNKGGSITRDYEAAKNSYYSLGDSSVRYFDGFGSSFPNALEAQRSMRQKIVGGGSLGFYNVPFFVDSNVATKRINPLNGGDVSQWEKNISDNISKIIQDNITNAPNPYTIKFGDGIAKVDYFDEIFKNFKDSISNDFYHDRHNNNQINWGIYSKHGTAAFNWKQDSWKIGDYKVNDDEDYWIGIKGNNEKEQIKVHARDYGDNRFQIRSNNGNDFEYEFAVNDFTKLIKTPDSNEGTMHSQPIILPSYIRPTPYYPPVAFAGADIQQNYRDTFHNLISDKLKSLLPSLSLNKETILATLIKPSSTQSNDIDFGFDANKEKVTFGSSNIKMDYSNMQASYYSVEKPFSIFGLANNNYFYANALPGQIDYWHSVPVPGFEASINNAQNNMKKNFSFLNTLMNIGKNSTTPITICKDGKEIFSATLKNDGKTYSIVQNSMKVSENNNKEPMKAPINDEAPIDDPLYAINFLVNDLRKINGSSDPNAIKDILHKWDRRTDGLVKDVVVAVTQVKQIQNNINLKLLVNNIKLLISKYGSSNSLLAKLATEISDNIKTNQFVFMNDNISEAKLYQTEYVIDSFDRIDPQFLNWDAPTTQEQYQKELTNSQNVMPPAVQVLYDPDGKQFISDNYQFDTEGVMEYNFLRDIVVRRDNDHIYIDGYSNPFSNVVTSIYHLHLNDEDLYFDTFNHLKEYTYQYIIDNSQVL